MDAFWFGVFLTCLATFANNDILAAKWMLTPFSLCYTVYFLGSDSYQIYWDKRISEHIKYQKE